MTSPPPNPERLNGAVGEWIEAGAWALGRGEWRAQFMEVLDGQLETAQLLLEKVVRSLGDLEELGVTSTVRAALDEKRVAREAEIAALDNRRNGIRPLVDSGGPFRAPDMVRWRRAAAARPGPCVRELAALEVGGIAAAAGAGSRLSDAAAAYAAAMSEVVTNAQHVNARLRARRVLLENADTAEEKQGAKTALVDVAQEALCAVMDALEAEIALCAAVGEARAALLGELTLTGEEEPAEDAVWVPHWLWTRCARQLKGARREAASARYEAIRSAWPQWLGAMDPSPVRRLADPKDAPAASPAVEAEPEPDSTVDAGEPVVPGVGRERPLRPTMPLDASALPDALNAASGSSTPDVSDDRGPTRQELPAAVPRDLRRTVKLDTIDPAALDSASVAEPAPPPPTKRPRMRTAKLETIPADLRQRLDAADGDIGDVVQGPAPRAVLYVVFEGGTPVAYELGGGVTRIGSSPECEVSLSDPGAAPVHARIEVREGWHWLVDGGTPTGTRIGDETVTEMPLSPGDPIEIGRTRLVFGRPGDELKPAPGSTAPRTPERSGRRPGVWMWLGLVVGLGLLTGVGFWLYSVYGS